MSLLPGDEGRLLSVSSCPQCPASGASLLWLCFTWCIGSQSKVSSKGSLLLDFLLFRLRWEGTGAAGPRDAEQKWASAALQQQAPWLLCFKKYTAVKGCSRGCTAVSAVQGRAVVKSTLMSSWVGELHEAERCKRCNIALVFLAFRSTQGAIV